jgi:hypothetical protein
MDDADSLLRRLRRSASAGAAILVVVGWAAAAAHAQQNAQGVDFSAVAGRPLTTTVATFLGTGVAGDYSAAISWGDGRARSAGEVLPAASCPFPDFNCFEVRGTHTYEALGSFSVVAAVSGPDGAVQARATARVTAPPAPPPPAPGPVARIAAAEPQVRPGQPAILDASSSAGQIVRYEFDLNGNGTYETKGPSPAASVIHTAPGPKQVAVRVVGADGTSSTAATTVTVAGPPVPPSGGGQPLQEGTVTGSIHASAGDASIDAAIKNYMCPTMVQVGVAELAMAPTWGDVCFERQTKSGLKHPVYPRFLAQGKQVLLNGLHVMTNGRVLISEGLKWIEVQTPGSLPGRADIIAAQPPGYGGAFSPNWTFGRWDVSKPGVVATFPERLTGAEFLGLPVVEKDTPISFTATARAEFPVFVTLPFTEFTLWPKNPPTGKPFTVRAGNGDGIEVEGSYQYAFDLPLGIFEIEGTIAYSLQGGSHVWSGGFALRIPDTPIDQIKGQISFRDGDLEQAAVDVPFARPGLGPIGCCVYLVGMTGTLTENDIEATATFAAGPTLIGDFRAAEATASVNWRFSPFMLVLKADQLKIAKWDVSATVQALVTKSMFLALAYWNDGLGPLSWAANVEVRIGKPWYVAGGGTACFEVFIKGCANVHAAAGPKGIAACGKVSPFPAGGIRVPWNPLNFSDWSSWWGCSFSGVKAKVAIAAAAGSARVRVPRGLRRVLLAVRGRGSQPHVRVQGPRGPALTTPAPGQSTASGPGWAATRSTSDATTYVVVERPSAGLWTIDELPGSPAVASVAIARPLPQRLARGRVSGRGRTRVLSYRVAQASGTRVTFVERGGDPRASDPERVVEQTIGRATGRRGTIRFTPAEGRLRRRRIDAVVESDGVVVRSERVARFTAPRFRLPARPRVTVRRAGRTLTARWPAVAGARAYQTFVNLGDGGTTYRRTRRRSMRLPGFGPLGSARVEVRAVTDAGYFGRPGFAVVRAARRFTVARRQRIATVLRRKGFRAHCVAAGDGRCEVRVTAGGRTLGAGARRLRHGRRGRITVRLTRRGLRALAAARRAGRPLRATVVPTVPGAGAAPVRVTFR